MQSNGIPEHPSGFLSTHHIALLTGFSRRSIQRKIKRWQSLRNGLKVTKTEAGASVVQLKEWERFTDYMQKNEIKL